MSIRLLLISITLLFSSNIVGASQTWIEKNTINQLCEKITCHQQIQEYFNKYYFGKTFHKALVISYYKSGNKYINDYFGYSYEAGSSADARQKAITMCNKHGKKCELLLLNNEVKNKELYNQLTKKTSTLTSNNTSLPSNSVSWFDSWKCKSGFYKNKNKCSKLPSNALANGTVDGYFCKSGYKSNSSKTSCVIKNTSNSSASKTDLNCGSNYFQKNNKCNRLPSNAYASDSIYIGWRCNEGYYQDSKYNRCVKLPKDGKANTSGGFHCVFGYYKNNKICSKLPMNAVAQSSVTGGYYCKKGYIKSTAQNKCVKQIKIPENAYATEDGWNCRSSFYKSKNSCLSLPVFAIANVTSDGYTCLSGYNKNISQNKCVLQNTMIPSGAIASSNAQGWRCYSGYYQDDRKCKELPLYAIAYSDNDGFYCQSGYRKSSAQNSCIKKINNYVPPNAYAIGSGWKCYSDFVEVGNSCKIAIKNGRYSNDGKTIICNSGYDYQWRQSRGQGCYKIDSLKIAEQEALKEKAKKVFAEVKKKAEENSNSNQITETEKSVEDESSSIEMEIVFWNSIKDNNDPEEYQFYLDEYPNGSFVKLAKRRINKLSETPQNNKPELNYGNYHALVIGNDKYKHLSPLENAVNDANDVASLLRSKYNFNVNLLTNATRDEIVSALSDLRSTISSSDNLLVYYAGHGELDTKADEGFWLPVDAKRNNQVHWVANETIMRSVRAMEAKHVMVVADSCFSGTMTRGIKIKDNSPDYIKKMVQKKARTVLTSGGLEPVSDVGGGNNSVFASSFLNALRDNNGVIDGNKLFSIIRAKVMLDSDQTPEYGNIRKAGHDGGDFIFVSK